MEYQEFEAKTVDEAIVAAMRAFRSSFEELDIEIISEGNKGIFGIGSKLAKIKAAPASAEKPARPEPSQPKPEPVKAEKTETQTEDLPEDKPAPVSADVLEDAAKILSELLAHMNIDAQVEVLEDQGLNIVGDGSGLVIGKRGQTLDALQFIVNRMLNRERQNPAYINIDSEGYRVRHVENLRSMALKMGQKACRTGHSVSLDRMNPHDRRIIHLTLKDDSSVNTRSVGEGALKKVVIVPRKASRS